MSENMNIREQAKHNAEMAERVQTMRAMERLMINMGGKDGYIKWLQALPETAGLSSIGIVGTEALRDIAENDADYNAVVQAFAAHMGPVLTSMVEV